jgi:outer membrane receptor for ferrienterochelin and colicin
VLPSFEEHRRVGLGQFLTREDLAKLEGQSVSSILGRFNGVSMTRGRGGNAWLASSRRVGANRLPTSEDRSLGARPACYAHVWVDNMPMYRARPQEPLFNLNTIPTDRIEAIEYYAGPGSTPPRYNDLNATCGVMVIWTRR